MTGPMGLPRIFPCLLLVCVLYWGSLSILSALADESLPAPSAPMLAGERGAVPEHEGRGPLAVARGEKRSEQKDAEAGKSDDEETSVSHSRTDASFFLEDEDAVPGSFLGIFDHDDADGNESGFSGSEGARKAKGPIEKNSKGKQQRGNKKAPAQRGKGAAAPGRPGRDGQQAAGASPRPGGLEAGPQHGRPELLFREDGDQDRLGMAQAPGASDAVVIDESALRRPATKRRPSLSRDSALTPALLLPLVTTIFCFFAYRTLSPIAKRMGRARNGARSAQ